MHPVTIYSFLLALVALVGVIVLVALGKVPTDVGVPIIATLGGSSVGVAGIGAVSRSNKPDSTTGDVGYVDPNV